MTSQKPRVDLKRRRVKKSTRKKEDDEDTKPKVRRTSTRKKTVDQTTEEPRTKRARKRKRDDSSTSTSSPPTTLSIPLYRPRRSKFRNKDVNKDPNESLKQPITVLNPKEPDPYTLPKGWETSVDDLDLSAPKEKPVQVEVEKLRKFTKVPIKKLGLELTGGNQGGLYPKDESLRTELPETSDYTKSRPQQVLSQMSEVMRYQSEQEGETPVEVQFGYGKTKGGGLDLYTSSNNQSSQEWLLKALKNPGKHLKEAARSEDPHIQQVALKLLFLKEQNEERRKQIRNEPDKEKLEKDLDLTESLYGKLLSGPVNVVVNPSDRHAEQNIGDILHDNEQYTESDIQGTMIRCEGCSSELGVNLQDEEGKGVIGRTYSSQSEKSRHKHTFEEIREGRVRVATNRSRRSRSTSPPRVPVTKTTKTDEPKKKKRKKNK